MQATSGDLINDDAKERKDIITDGQQSRRPRSRHSKEKKDVWFERIERKEKALVSFPMVLLVVVITQRSRIDLIPPPPLFN